MASTQVAPTQDGSTRVASTQVESTRLKALMGQYQYISPRVVAEALFCVSSKNLPESEKKILVDQTLRSINEAAKERGALRSYTTTFLSNTRLSSYTTGRFKEGWTPSMLRGKGAKAYRKAVLIGCTYSGSSQALRGPSHDVGSMYSLLRGSYGWQSSEIIVMTDVVADESRYLYHTIPTKSNILKIASALAKTASPGDVLFFYFSGHGGQITAKAPYPFDSDDNKDEYIEPCDGFLGGERNIILDHDLRRVLCEPLPVGAKLTCVFDSSHSGTILDLNYYKRDSRAPTVHGPVHYPRGLDVLCISATEDHVEAEEHTDLAHGVFTRLLKKKLKETPRILAEELVSGLNDTLRRRGLEQRATISAATTGVSSLRFFDLHGPAVFTPYGEYGD